MSSEAEDRDHQVFGDLNSQNLLLVFLGINCDYDFLAYNLIVGYHLVKTEVGLFVVCGQSVYLALYFVEFVPLAVGSHQGQILLMKGFNLCVVLRMLFEIGYRIDMLDVVLPQEGELEELVYFCLDRGLLGNVLD